MCLTAYAKEDQWNGIDTVFQSTGKRHSASLMASIKLEIAFKAECANWNNARIFFDIKLSQRPPEHTPAHIIYVAGNAEGLTEASHTLVIPLEPGTEWHKCQFNLTETVLSEKAEKKGLGGLDNAFDTIRIGVESRSGEKIAAWVDDFSIHIRKGAQDTLEMQKKIAREIGKKYSVIPFIGMEISEAGPHKNCFSSQVPVIPYEALNYQVSHEQGCDWVKQHGGIFSLNHPFEQFKRADIHKLNLEEETNKLAQEYMETGCWGASLMEVGFPEGRYFPLQYHLKLWDMLAMSGIFLTGYGSSDNHSNQSGWYEGNNFATWLGVEVQKAEPEEADFVQAMKGGRAYTGNPVFVDDSVVLETERGVTMGSVIVTDAPTKIQIRFRCNSAKHRWIQRWIVNGNIAKESKIKTDVFEDYYCIEPIMPIELVRVEVYDENGICIMLTNPIYFYRKDLKTLNIPMERQVKDR